MILGSYGLKVTEGEVTIAGATIRPLDEEAWVHAPHCHAIPVLRTSKDSMVELRPHPAAASLRNLERLNPVFGRLWNEPPTNEQKGSNRGSKSGGDTFQIVCSPPSSCASHALTSIDLLFRGWPKESFLARALIACRMEQEAGADCSCKGTYAAENSPLWT